MYISIIPIVKYNLNTLYILYIYIETCKHIFATYFYVQYKY